MQQFDWKRVNWPNSIFLATTLFISLTAVPAYIWFFGVSWFHVVLFLIFFAITGLSITVGYHRLFSHLTFKASWPVRLGTLIFGAAAFENSALRWAADHRAHHKHVDGEEDPYDISRGFFHAHIGWMLYNGKPEPPLDGVKDLQRDPLLQWQHKNYLLIAILAGFGLPTLIGLLWGGPITALGGFLLAGVARVVFVNHMTFLINSLSHTWGKQPYSKRCSARDNAVLAWFTFGEGYHNFHHAFQHDYRNGVKPWQFDPTKWSIWLLNRIGLARDVRRIPNETILLAEIAERQAQLLLKLEAAPTPMSDSVKAALLRAQESLYEAFRHWEERKAEYMLTAALKVQASRERVAELQSEFREARQRLRDAISEWQQAHRLAQAALA